MADLGITTRPELLGTFGMVASTHWLASAAGMAVLERGGNAFDAAVACGFVLQIVEPHLNGPGGDMTALTYSVSEDRVRALCGQGPAPATATISAMTALRVQAIPGMGLLPACVPGAFDAWMLMLLEYGTWQLRDVLEYSIGYAEHGYPVIPGIRDRIESIASVLSEEWHTSAGIYLPHGRVPQPGELLANTLWADCLKRLVKESESIGGAGRESQIEAARHIWREGFIAEAIDTFVDGALVLDETGARLPGFLRGSDMASWAAGFEAPKSYVYGDWKVYKTPQWGQGPVFLQQLALLNGFDLSTMDPVGPDFVHLITEAAKLAYSDRDAYYGDPNFADDVVDDLLSKANTSLRQRLITQSAVLSPEPSRLGGLHGKLPYYPSADGVVGSGEPTVLGRNKPGDTCHLDIVDRWGNTVAATPSGGWLHTSPAIPGLGFALGTRAQVFNMESGHPNALAPFKRPRTTLSPSIAEHSDKGRLAFGTPGGDQQDQWALTFFIRLASRVKFPNMQEIIDLPMFHTEDMQGSFYPHERKPKSLILEGRIPEATLAELRARGHDVSTSGDWSQGRLSAARYHSKARLLSAAANPRLMQGYAMGR